MIVFQYNDKLKQYKKLKLTEITDLPVLLNSDSILLFVKPKRYKVWIWYGSNTTTKMRFFSAILAPNVIDKYGSGFRIIAVDESNEPLGFKVMIGLEKEPDNPEVKKSLLYEGTEEDLELLESLKREKELLMRLRDSDI